MAMATLDAAGGLSADSPRCAARCTVANSGQSGRMRLGPVVNVDLLVPQHRTLWLWVLGPTVLHAQIVPGTILRICHTHIRYILIIIRLHSSRNMYHIIVIHIFLYIYIYMHAKTLVHLVQYMYVCAQKNHACVCLPMLTLTHTHTCTTVTCMCQYHRKRISKPVACRCTNLNAPMSRNT